MIQQNQPLQLHEETLLGVLEGGGVVQGEGGCSWGALRIPREDWGNLGNIRECSENHQRRLRILLNPLVTKHGFHRKNDETLGSPWSFATPFRDVSGFDLNGCHIEIDRSAAGFSLNLGDPKKTETG